MTRQTPARQPAPDQPPVGPDGVNRAMAAGLLHRGMMAVDRLNQQPTLLLLFLLLTLGGLVWLVWTVSGSGLALPAALITLTGMGFDAAMLNTLPRLGISFGPWRGQMLPLAVPRTAAALLLALPALAGAAQSGLLLLGAAQLAGTLLLYWAGFVEPRLVQLTKQTVALPHWPAAAPPLRVLHVSDLHVERLGRREAQVATLVEQLAPDLVLISGDYVNLSYQRDPQTLAQIDGLLRRLTGRYGSFGVLGTPLVDLYDTVPSLFSGDQPVRLLRNEAVDLDCGAGRALTLLGVDCSHHMPTDTARLAATLAGSSSAKPRLLLYHSPELMPAAAACGIDLYLCGHTHGGQVRLPFIGAVITSSQLGRRFVMGRYEVKKTRLYVSRGVGLEGASAPRVRLLARPEITLFTLVPAAATSG